MWILLALIIAESSAVAQDQSLALTLPERFRFSERSNFSRTESGRYVGLTSRQVNGYLTRTNTVDEASSDVTSAPMATEDARYEGRVLIFERTLRDMTRVGRAVDSSYEAETVMDPLRAFIGQATVSRYRAIPTLPSIPVAPGDTWTAPGSLVVDLPGGEPQVTVEVEVSYRYEGRGALDGEPVHRVTGQFATRYPPLADPDEEELPPPLRPDIRRIVGRHNLTILIPADSRAPFFIRDELEEQYETASAPSTLLRGHTLLFVHGLSLAGRTEVADALQESLDRTETGDVAVEQTATGTRLTIRNIGFVPDQAVILPEERYRLDGIAEALSAIEGVRYLIVGHTADVGSAESQMKLSWRRAEVVSARLATRGVDPARIDLDGRGGTEPVASNETESGRAQNRRVEIYVLEE